MDFQRRRSSSRQRLLFTVNLGIVCGELLDARSPGLEDVRIVDAHVRERIGWLLPGHPDKWWEITGSTDAGSLGAEVGELVTREAVPYIMRHLTTRQSWTCGSRSSPPG